MLRVKADAPAGLYTVGPISGPDWQPGEARSLADCLAFDPDVNRIVPLSEPRAAAIAAASGGVVELVPDPDPVPAPRKRGATSEED